jgi:trigger factor
MDIKKQDMSTPVKYVVTVDAEDLETRKQEAYEKQKPHLVVQGFRKGNVPRNVAETHFGVENLYRTVLDSIFKDVYFIEPCIVNTFDYKFYGDLKNKSHLMIEFIADVKPTVTLPSLDIVKKSIEKVDIQVTEKDIEDRIQLEIKRSEKIEDTTKEVLENLDVAVIDFEGFIEGELEPFKGGTAKGYQIRVNDIVNGKKQFIDNFEDQLVGMRLNETKKIYVKFPDDYKDKNLASKKAVFNVLLKSIKSKTILEYNEEFVKSKGFDCLKSYEDFLKSQIFDFKKKNSENDLRKQIIMKVVEQSAISPIPQIMINRENEKEWSRLLNRLGKTEEQLKKEKITKENYFENVTPKSIELLKTSLVLEEVAKKNNLNANEDEIVQYVLKISNKLQYDKEKEEKIKTDLKTNQQQYRLMETAVVNEKTIEFLINELTD